MIKIKHPYGITKFKEIMKFNNKRYHLVEAFPNYGECEGYKQAKSWAKAERERGYPTIILNKINASAVYEQRKRKK